MQYADFARMVSEMEPAGELLVEMHGGDGEPEISLERLNSATLKEADESPIVLTIDFRTKDEKCKSPSP